MGLNKSRIKDLAVGDLVTHVLYGKEWVGVILSFKEQSETPGPRSEKALVQVQPGTKYETFFKDKVSKLDKISETIGYVTTNWLFKMEVRRADP